MGLIVARAPVPAQSAAGELALASGGGVVSGIVKGGRIPSRKGAGTPQWGGGSWYTDVCILPDNAWRRFRGRMSSIV
jgi:hypothetical protein